MPGTKEVQLRSEAATRAPQRILDLLRISLYAVDEGGRVRELAGRGTVPDEQAVPELFRSCILQDRETSHPTRRCMRVPDRRCLRHRRKQCSAIYRRLDCAVTGVDGYLSDRVERATP